MSISPFPAKLNSRSLVLVDGPDWRSFLQGLITQDVETLAPGELRYGALLTPQGRVLGDLFIAGQADGALLDVDATQREALVQRLSMYRLRAKVGVRAVAGAVMVSDRPGPGWMADPRAPGLGFRRYGDAPDGLAGEAGYEALRLSLGAPSAADLGVDTTYPVEANLDLLGGIDFQKGCYVGQETTSRMKRRGKVKTRMLPIGFEGPPPAFGAEVLAGELRAGTVLSGIEGRALASLRLDRIDGPLTVDGRAVHVEKPAWFRP